MFYHWTKVSNLKLIYFYKSFIDLRDIYNLTIQGKIYLLNTKNNILKKSIVKTTWLKKKKGTNCGIVQKKKLKFNIFKLKNIYIKF